MQANKRAYRGRVVQMDQAFSVLDDAVVWIEGNRIKAVLDAAATPPPGFEHMMPLDTGGTLYPGLIELHNHLGYDILRLWQIPAKYGNRGQWRGKPAYRAAISGPMGVLGRTPGIPPAIARYTEAKCLMGGTTTSQGVTLASASGIARYFRGIVRNVEESLDGTLPDAMARLADFVAKDKDLFLRYLRDYPCLLVHLSEGVDASARDHFLDMQIGPDEWAIGPALTGIHCNALNRQDFDRLASFGAGMVWSPLSNLMLYGATADIAAAKAAGVRIGLGSDWSPSGSKNLLHELKVVRAVSDVQNLGFNDRDIIAMATISAAGLLRWNRYLGSLEAGKLADFLVVRGTNGDAYRHLLDANEEKIELVVIDGMPRYATAALRAGFSGAGEEVTVGAEKRYLNLDDANSDIIVAGLSLAAATEALTGAMARLPALQRDTDVLNAAPPLSPMSVREVAPDRTRRDQWTLVLDQDEPLDLNLRPRFHDELALPSAIRASSLPEALALPLTAQDLDPLTVAGDPGYYAALATQPNVPRPILDLLHP